MEEARKIASIREEQLILYFAPLVDIGHLKNAELESKLQKCKGRVVLRGDSVIDDSGSYAVFTEQGSSASHQRAAKVMGSHSKATRMCRTTSRRSISVHSGKDGGCSRITDHDTSGQNLERNLCGRPFSGLLWERNLKKFSWDMDGKKYRTGKVYSCIESKVYSHRYTWKTNAWKETKKPQS